MRRSLPFVVPLSRFRRAAVTVREMVDDGDDWRPALLHSRRGGRTLCACAVYRVPYTGAGFPLGYHSLIMLTHRGSRASRRKTRFAESAPPCPSQIRLSYLLFLSRGGYPMSRSLLLRCALDGAFPGVVANGSGKTCGDSVLRAFSHFGGTPAWTIFFFVVPFLC